MNKTELNTTDEIRMISDEDLGAVAGGFQVYTGGGGGRVVGNPNNHHVGIGVASFIIAAGLAIAFSL